MRLNQSKNFGKISIVIGLAFIVAGCATQPSPPVVEPPGFLMGLVHGFIIIFSLVGSIFTDVRIYAYPNSGLWYDVGFFIGVMFVLGGGGASSRRGKR